MKIKDILTEAISLSALTSGKVTTYLVGGAVRDEAMGEESNDDDYVVVGATPKLLQSLGFEKVGKDFPVFLHPTTKDEFALARTERSTGRGYDDFEVNYDRSVTLEDDLLRRDITINAMAKEVVGWNNDGSPILDDKIIDPYGGLNDIKNGIIKPTSDAFADDAVRVLRAARFASKYNFELDPSLAGVVDKMVKSGELDSLKPERVWTELAEKTLAKVKTPSVFFEKMQAMGALETVFPELAPIDWKQLDLTSGVEARMLVLLQNTDAAGIETLATKRFKSTSVIREAALGLRAAMDAVDSSGRLDGETLLRVLKALGMPGSKANLGFIKDALRVIRNPLLPPRTIDKGVDVIKSISFGDLSPEEQQTLKGGDRGRAIAQLHINALNELIGQIHG